MSESAPVFNLLAFYLSSFQLTISPASRNTTPAPAEIHPIQRNAFKFTSIVRPSVLSVSKLSTLFPISPIPGAKITLQIRPSTPSEKRPLYLFLENVVGLLSHDRGRTFGVILSALYDLGYHVEWTVLHSKHFGVPQSRRRLFLIGYLDPRCAGKILPVFGADAKALVQIVHGRLGKRVYDSAGIACTQDTSRQSGLYFVDLTKGDPKITPNARCLHTRQDGSLTNFKGQNSGILYIKEATKKGYKEAHEGDSIDLGFAGSNTRRGRVFAGVAHTVDTANTHGIVLRGVRVRRLMPRECFRLQGFSEDQIDKILAINSDAQAYKQAGNSVTVTVIEAIGRRIRAADTELHDKEEGRDVCPTM